MTGERQGPEEQLASSESIEAGERRAEVREEPPAAQPTEGAAPPEAQTERVSGKEPTEASPAERGEGAGLEALRAQARPGRPPMTPEERAAAVARARALREGAPAPPATERGQAAPPERPAREAAPRGPQPPPEGSIFDIFKRVLPDVEWLEAVQGASDVILTIRREDVPRVMSVAKEHPDLALDFLRSVHGVDQQPEGLDVIYLLHSYKHKHSVEIKARVPLEDPHIRSVTSIWRGADWHERETRDMFGIIFDGHPNLKPLLLPEDLLDVYPLRKDYPLAEIEIIQGEGASQEEGGEEIE